jgi:hypothetical protein
MPKIRGIKPDFWTDEDIVELSVPARLLFIGLWTYACDNGHLQDKSKQIKMRIFPGDDVNAAELLRELETSGRILRGGGWITIPNLTEHQKPDRRYFTTCDKAGCVDPPEKVSQRESRRAHAVHTPSAPSAHDGGTPGALGDGDGDGEVMVRGEAADKPPAAKRGQQLPDTFRPSEAHVDLASSLGIDLRAEWPSSSTTTSPRLVMKDWDAALRKWIRNAQEVRRSSKAPLAAVTDPSQLPPVQTSWMERR